MANPNPFSISAMLNSLQELRFAAARVTMVNIMTNSQEDVAQFEDMISKLDIKVLKIMASLLTSDSDYFMAIARNKFGSKRIQQLMGKSDDVDTFFFTAILQLFLHVMTDEHASYVAIRGIQVFNRDKKKSMYKVILQYVLHLARDQHGWITLNEFITASSDDPYYRDQLLDIVAHNALLLSNDDYGNFVIQHVLKLNDFRCMYNIELNLRGHCVELSFKMYGSYIVERLLEVEGSIMEAVIMELLECKGERLMRLAKSEYGNFVVSTALGLTDDILTADLYMGLVNKLMPFRDLLRKSPGSNIAAILDPFHSRRISLSQTK